MFKKVNKETINILWKRVSWTNQKKRYSNHQRKEKSKRDIWFEGRQALGLFVAECFDKNEAFSYSLTIYPLGLSSLQGTLHKSRTKYLFRNYLIDSTTAFLEIPSELNPVVIYDAMVVIRSFPSHTANMGWFTQNSY